jgi:hypothetical protein
MTMLFISFCSFILSIIGTIRLAGQPDSFEGWAIVRGIGSILVVVGCFFWILISLVGLSVLDM